MKSLMTVCLLVSLMLAASATAQMQSNGVFIPQVLMDLDGTWVILDEFISVGSFFTGGGDSPWTWNTGGVVRFTITDLYVVSDQFEVWDNGVLHTTTPAMPDYDDLGLGAYDSPPWTSNPDAALADGRFSSAVIYFPAGAHSITIKTIHIPPGFGDSTVSFKADEWDPQIDIKPGSCPNPFNAKSQGSVPVAIIGSDILDVTTIDVSSITLNGVPALEDFEIKDTTQPDEDNDDCYTCFNADDPANFNCDLWIGDPEDGVAGQDGVLDSYCGDGYPDLIVKFDTQALAAAIGEADRDECVTLLLTGTTDDGGPIEASDSVVIKTKIK